MGSSKILQTIVHGTWEAYADPVGTLVKDFEAIAKSDRALQLSPKDAARLTDLYKNYQKALKGIAMVDDVTYQAVENVWFQLCELLSKTSGCQKLAGLGQVLRDAYDLKADATTAEGTAEE